MPEPAAPLPTLALDSATLHDLDADLEREWLVTNGLGGYALGSVCGATTRSYSGLLVAAVRPPVDRAVLVTKFDEVVTLHDGTALALGTNEYADGTIYPRGYEFLAAFALEGSLPRWTFDLGQGATLEKRIWMEHGSNITFVQYCYVADSAASPVMLALTPFCLDRDHHSVTQGAEDWHFLVDAAPAACTVRAFAGAMPYHLIAGPTARFTASGEWNWHIFHRQEHARGLPDSEDAYMPGCFEVTLAPGETATLALSAEATLPAMLAALGGPQHEAICIAALDREQAREAALLAQADTAAHGDELFTRLALAADQFIVARSDAERAEQPETQVTVIAGYPWFTDWGRDTMIALPGVTLTTRRYAEARGLLRTFARYVNQGMLPNRFPDGSTAPEYNTVDATLWYFHAISAYVDATQDWSLLDDLFPLLADIIEWHVRGTRYGIGVDPADGLLRAGASGMQLTWMDAKVGDWVVTPRRGKPVEVNALWYHALRLMGFWSRWLHRDASRYDTLCAAVEQHFLPRFWYAAGGYLYDVVDVEGEAGAVDWSLRPNQLVALALAKPLIPEAQALSIMEIAERELLTPLGLRTLAPNDPRYQGAYGGDQQARDAAYHQGTVWPWLLGVYTDACISVYGDSGRMDDRLKPFMAHLSVAGLGSISEIVQGNPPFAPCGCPAQAWSVAELLRVSSLLHERR
jgi:predicted glycogen debranching enzyme